jgi:hypothetical protein
MRVASFTFSAFVVSGLDRAPPFPAADILATAFTTATRLITPGRE